MKESSNVESFDYDSRSRVLIVEFTGGRRYRYPNVSRQRFSAFSRADSLGAYVNTKLKNLPSKKI